MRRDFLAIAWTDPADGARALEIASRAASELDLVLRLDAPGLIVLSNQALTAVRLAGEQGVVLGDLFRRSDAAEPIGALDAAESQRVIESDGDELIERCWGDYVAFLAGGASKVLRDPSAGLPGFFSAIDGLLLFYSDVAIPLDLDLLAAEIDWASVHHSLAAAGPRSPQSNLRNVRELVPGTVLTVGRRAWRTRIAWDPWTFAAPDRQIRDRDEAVADLRAALMSSTKAIAGLHEVALVELSGGLDSSIVSSCLAAAHIDIRCANLLTAEPGADERRYAQAVAGRIGAPLAVLALAAADLDMLAPPRRRSAWPVDHPLARLVDLALEGEARRQGVDGLFSGSGGDYVLGYLGTSAPAADALLAFGPGKTFARAACDVAALHRCTVWKAARLAVRKAVTRRGAVTDAPPPFVRPPPALDVEPHPWLPAPRRIWPGKVQQVTALAYGHAVREGRERVDVGPQRMPIWSQPVVEHCLRTPTWMAVTGGRNRAAARDAFADLLPEIVLNRRTKGDFTGLIASIYDRNRTAVKDLLSNGLLVENGVLDPRLLTDYVALERAPSDILFTQILQVATTELWARSWRAGSARLARPLCARAPSRPQA